MGIQVESLPNTIDGLLVSSMESLALPVLHKIFVVSLRQFEAGPQSKALTKLPVPYYVVSLIVDQAQELLRQTAKQIAHYFGYHFPYFRMKQADLEHPNSNQGYFPNTQWNSSASNYFGYRMPNSPATAVAPHTDDDLFHTAIFWLTQGEVAGR